MNAVLVSLEFLGWLYSGGIKEFSKAWVNIHWFLYHFFSVPELIRTLFSPLKRLKESYRGGFDPEKFFSALAVNIIMRITGFITRLFILFAALCAQITALVLGMLFFVFFLATPIIGPLGILVGLLLIFA